MGLSGTPISQHSVDEGKSAIAYNYIILVNLESKLQTV